MVHRTDILAANNLISRLTSTIRAPWRSSLTTPNSAIVPGWLVLPTQQDRWLVRTPAMAGTTMRLVDLPALIELLRAEWAPAAARVIAREQARHMLTSRTKRKAA